MCAHSAPAEAAVKAMLEAQVLPSLTRALSDPLPAIRLHSTAMLRYLLCEGLFL
jgi:hypothetical protein